jgi:putative ABC transport system substrate-binding protein
MMPIIRQLMPSAKKLGTLYAPSEVNSVYSYELLVESAKEANYELEAKGVNATTEVLDAIQSLCDLHLDAICLSNSNVTSSTFPTIAQATSKAKLPVFAFLGSTAKQGAVAVLTRDYFDMGVDSATIAARVMRGEAAASIPFHQSTTCKLYLNLVAAQKHGLTIPDAMIKSADLVIDK